MMREFYKKIKLLFSICIPLVSSFSLSIKLFVTTFFFIKFKKIYLFTIFLERHTKTVLLAKKLLIVSFNQNKLINK